MSRLISLAAGVLPEFSAEAVVDAAASAGFEAVGLRLDGDPCSPERTAALRRRIEDAGLVLLDAEVLWMRPGAFDESLYHVIDTAAALGARNLLTVSADPNAGATVEKFGLICDRAAEVGIPVSLEYGYFSAVQTVQAALGVLSAVDRVNGHLLVDPLHLSRSCGSVADIAALPSHLFSYAQFCDAGPDAPAPEDKEAIYQEALDGRLHLGDGVIPLAELLGCWRPDLPLSVELRSKRLRDDFPAADERARHLHARCAEWLARYDRR